MKSGRRPTSTRVLDLRGSWRAKANQLSQERPAPAPNHAPPAPRWLGKQTRSYWKKFSQELAQHGLITPLTLELLTRYCVALVRWQEAQKYIETHSVICATVTGYLYTHPYTRLAKELGQELTRLEQEMGMTPGARKSLGLDPVQEKDTHADDAPDKTRFFRKVK